MSSARKNIDWGQVPLGEEPDTALAKRLGVSPAAVKWQRDARGILAFHAVRRRLDLGHVRDVLGTASDREIAERHGLGIWQISYARRKLGISPRRTSWDEFPLGEVFDADLAEALGVDFTCVHEARTRRGIPRYEEIRQCPCGEHFIAFHRRQRYCSKICQRYHWQLVNRHGMAPEAADCGVAMRAYRSTLKKKGRKSDVENVERDPGSDS